jgi:hypothetical protein
MYNNLKVRCKKFMILKEKVMGLKIKFTIIYQEQLFWNRHANKLFHNLTILFLRKLKKLYCANFPVAYKKSEFLFNWRCINELICQGNFLK